jgi:hypothetical protein
VDPFPDPDGKNNPQKKNKMKKVHVLKCWMFSFEIKAFSVPIPWMSFLEA